MRCEVRNGAICHGLLPVALSAVAPFAVHRDADLLGPTGHGFGTASRATNRTTRSLVNAWPRKVTMAPPGSSRSLTVTATVEGHSARAPIRIEQAQLQRPFSFGRDIAGILTRRGCNTIACHGSVKGAVDSSCPRVRSTHARITSGSQKAAAIRTMAVAHGGGLKLPKDSGTIFPTPSSLPRPTSAGNRCVSSWAGAWIARSATTMRTGRRISFGVWRHSLIVYSS